MGEDYVEEKDWVWPMDETETAYGDDARSSRRYIQSKHVSLCFVARLTRYQTVREGCGNTRLRRTFHIVRVTSAATVVAWLR